MRLNVRGMAFGVLLLLLMVACGSTANAQDLLPEQSAEKAQQVLQQVIAALGGPAYLNVRDTTCEGRIAQFGTNDELMGFTLFRDLWTLPDKNRTEYISKGEHTFLGFFIGTEDLSITHGGVMVTIFNGGEGWMLDKGGVSNQADDVIKVFVEQVKSGMNNMLRVRKNEPGVEAHYGGTDIIDLKEAEWVEFTDRDHRNLRLAVDRSTHLPLRWVVTTRDPETRQYTETITTYTQYISMDGVKTPLSLVRSRNDRKLTQTFLTSCKYNSDLDAQLFSRESLVARAKETTKKGYNDAKDKN